MRKSFTASLALVAVLALAVPTLAAPGARENAPAPTLTRVVKMLKRAFGVKTAADPIMPIPAPTTTT